jgi:hypothetical protein
MPDDGQSAKTNSYECNTPSSEPFRISLYIDIVEVVVGLEQGGILRKYVRREMHLEVCWENHLRFQPHGRSNM